MKKTDNRVRPRLLWVGKCIAVATLVSAMSILFIFGHDYVTQCSYFNAQKMTVTGARTLSAAQVLHQGGIAAGVNTLSLNLALVRKRLLAHPMIASASVSRELPSTIVVHITEHEPLAVLDLGRKYIINMNGEIFKKWEETDSKKLPVVTGLTFSGITAKHNGAGRPFRAVLTVLRLGKKHGGFLTGHRVCGIEVDKELGLTLLTDEKIKTVKLGYDDYGEKIRKLEHVLSYLKAHDRFANVDAIDLINLNRIVVTPAVNQSPESEQREV